MSNVPSWNFEACPTTIIQGLAATDADMSDWHSQVIAFVVTVAEDSDFEVVDNGYRRFPDVLVTEGVAVFFRGDQFGVWSDIPGELILTHGSMGHRKGAELIGRLKTLWQRASEQPAEWPTDNGLMTTDE